MNIRYCGTHHLGGTVVNLTQHALGEEQLKRCSAEMPVDTARVQYLLNIEDVCPIDLQDRAERLAIIAKETGAEYAHIGGAPFLMASLERALLAVGVTPVYSFSKRRSEEVVNADGTVSKRSVFSFEYWVVVTPIED